MADSLFQQAVDKVKEVLSPSGQQTTSPSANSQKDDNAATGTSFDMGMMQSILTAGMGSLSKEDQQKVQEFQQSFQSNTQSQPSPNNHNGKMDISGNVVSSAMKQLSMEEQQQLQQFQQTLGIESAQEINPQQPMVMGQETGSSAANQAASQEKTKVNALAEELGGKM
ncbi:hypothetical protein [Priestia abyssalis]|uniref:hypothetical protein n=1 Tax=Priestia abyssalis TaxID=1221450 RepID=UPI000995CC10|nr:hypothetical protein [Priestia abyssalis]